MATTSSHPKPWAPPTGKHQVTIGSSFHRALKARKLKDAPTPPPPKKSGLPDRDFYAVRYSFKPQSIDLSKNATIEVKKGAAENATIVAELPSTQVGEVHHFLGNETTASEVECVLIFDESTGQVSLEKIDSNLLLKFRKTGPSARSDVPASSPSPPLASTVSKKTSAASSSTSSFKNKDIPIDPELYRELVQGDEEEGEVIESPRPPTFRHNKQDVDYDEEMLALARPSPPPPSKSAPSVPGKAARPTKSLPKPHQDARSTPPATNSPVPPTQSRPATKLPPKPTAASSSSSRPAQPAAALPKASASSSTHTKNSSLSSTVSASGPASRSRPSTSATPAPIPPATKPKKTAKRPSDPIDAALTDTVDLPPPAKKLKASIPPKKKAPSPPPRAPSPLAFPGGPGTFAPPPIPGAKSGPSKVASSSKASAPPTKVAKPPSSKPAAPTAPRLALPTPAPPITVDNDSDEEWEDAVAVPPAAAAEASRFIIMEEEDPSLEPSVPRPPIQMEEFDGDNLVDDEDIFGSNKGEVEPDEYPDEDEDVDMEPVSVDNDEDDLNRELMQELEAAASEEDDEDDFLSAAMNGMDTANSGEPRKILSLNQFAGGNAEDDYSSTSDESDDDDDD